MRLKRKQQYEAAVARTRAKRMKWWHEARFGMFVHWGLYALLGRHEWAMCVEAIEKGQYEKLTRRFRPKDRPARQWARLARDAGMKYMVMTTKHHEGYCLWDTSQTDFNAVARGPGRDLVAEYVDACREFGLKIGFYYSLMDWNHPDGARCAFDPAARRRFLDFTHGCVRELMSNYGKIDILWYDVALPFDSHEGWESLAMNQMARALQPNIIINNRSRLDEDFSTPEEHVAAAEAGRGWESCMTFNKASWGYMPSAAADSYRARDIVAMLRQVTMGGGNLLLNIGPAPDGSVPPEAVEPLKTTGKWLARNGKCIYGAVDRTLDHRPTACGRVTQKGNTMYLWCHCWPGREIPIGGFSTKLKSARLLVSGRKVDFEQTGRRIVLKDLPRTSPDKLVGVTVIELKFASKPKHKYGPTVPALWYGQ